MAVSILSEEFLFARIGSMAGSKDARHSRIKRYDFVAGRLARFAEAWRCITSDACVIQTVRHGVRLDFLENPIQTAIPPKGVHGVMFHEELIEACSKELKDLLSKGVIRKIIDDSEGYRKTPTLTLQQVKLFTRSQ